MPDPRKRVLFLTTGLLMGGAETMLCKLLSRLDRGRFEPRVLSLRGENALSGRVRELGVPLIHLGWPRGFPTPWGVLALIREVRAAEPDLIQCWMYHANLAGTFARRFLPRPVPILWNVRKSMYDPRLERPLTGWVVRLGARFSAGADRILYNSRTAATQHEALGYDASKTLVIPNGFDTALFKPDPAARGRIRRELGVPPDAPLVGLIGRRHPQKDHANFLAAAAKVAVALPSARFLLAGPDVEPGNPALARLVARPGLGDKVLLLGERRDLPALNSALDVAVSSSAFGEGFPNVVGEAMACGVPCVVTDVGDSAWIVGRTGRAVPPRDASALAEALLAVLRMPRGKRRSLGAAARRRVQAEFSLARVSSAYERLYGEVLGNPGGDGTWRKKKRSRKLG